MPAIRLNANDIGRVIGGVPRRCLTISKTNAAQTITTETTHAYIRVTRVPLHARGSIVVSVALLFRHPGVKILKTGRCQLVQNTQCRRSKWQQADWQMLANCPTRHS